MRILILAAIGFGVAFSTLPCQTILAQDSGGISRLSSAAYGPDSPVRENKLFQYQTGHYGFAYNCDGEEEKRHNPAISWRNADQCQLPKRMGCLERVRHEVAQVSQRILDGMCDSGCEACQQQRRQAVTPACGCENCLASQNGDATIGIDLLVANHSDNEQGIEIATADPVSTRQRGSGLISRTRLESATEVELDIDEAQPLVGSVQVLSATTVEATQPPMESIEPPVARITSVTVGSGVKSVIGEASKATTEDVAEVSPPAPATSTHRMGLLERLKKVQSTQASDLLEPAKF